MYVARRQSLTVNWEPARGLRNFDTMLESLWDGVYILWQRNLPAESTLLYVGQGNIGSRMRSHRASFGFIDVLNPIMVSWTYVWAEEQRLGIEKYLHRRLVPLHSRSYHSGPEMEVNLPAEIGLVPMSIFDLLLV